MPWIQPKSPDEFKLGTKVKLTNRSQTTQGFCMNSPPSGIIGTEAKVRRIDSIDLIEFMPSEDDRLAQASLWSRWQRWDIWVDEVDSVNLFKVDHSHDTSSHPRAAPKFEFKTGDLVVLNMSIGEDELIHKSILLPEWASKLAGMSLEVKNTRLSHTDRIAVAESIGGRMWLIHPDHLILVSRTETTTQPLPQLIHPMDSQGERFERVMNANGRIGYRAVAAIESDPRLEPKPYVPLYKPSGHCKVCGKSGGCMHSRTSSDHRQPERTRHG